MQEAHIYAEASKTARLAELGLGEETLRQAVTDGELARASCTRNDPRVYPGQTAWARTTRGLREALVPRGWEPSEEANLPTIVSPDKTMAITVSSGDDGTGCLTRSPQTRNPKGTATLRAIFENHRQLRFGFIEDDEGKLPRLTWVLLVARVKGEVRCELSLPAAVGDGGRVTAWSERIILDPVALGVEAPVSAPENEPTVEIQVVRKAR